MPKLVRITTVPISLMMLLRGQMKFMKQNGFDVTMISSDGNETEELRAQEECPHISVKLTRKITPLIDLVSLFRLTIMLRRIRPDIVHTHTPKAGLIGMLAAKLAGVKIRLHTVAGLPWMESRGFKRRLLIAVEKLTAASATSVFPNSFVQKDFLVSIGLSPKKLKVIGNGSSNGINIGYFSLNDEITKQAADIKQRERINENARVWIFVGRIVKDKGITELIEAFSTLHKQFSDDVLLLVGNQEPELDPLDPQCKETLATHPGIRSCGFQKDIRPYLAASHVLVFPSYREGFPNVPMQAGAMGCALILSDINGCNEIVSNGVNGWLVPPKNADALLAAMLEARNNIALSDTFAKAIREKIEKGYSQSYLWNCLLNEYQSQLNMLTSKSDSCI